MSSPAATRSNDDWIQALAASGPEFDHAHAELRNHLLRGLHAAIKTDPSYLEDFAQEALIRIRQSLSAFRGDAHFLTWAMSVAIRVAFSELRRARWQDRSLDQMMAGGVIRPMSPGAPAEHAILQNQLAGILNRAIHGDLSERQRRAILAELGGAPLEEIARRLDINRNAVYKLLHDARRKLRDAILESGVALDDIHAFLERRSS